MIIQEKGPDGTNNDKHTTPDILEGGKFMVAKTTALNCFDYACLSLLFATGISWSATWRYQCIRMQR